MTYSSLPFYKLIILDMLNQVTRPLTNSLISDYMLKQDYASYFNIQQTLSELVEDQLITREQTYNSSFYRITDLGKESCDYFLHTLNPKIRQDIKNYLKEKNQEIIDSTSLITDYQLNRENEYMVHLKVTEKDTTLLDMSITVPYEETAKKVCENFRKKDSEIYSYLLRELL